ncbi:MAG: hypothetical protein AAFX90_10220 [Pseudomonadota bacterium]
MTKVIRLTPQMRVDPAVPRVETVIPFPKPRNHDEEIANVLAEYEANEERRLIHRALFEMEC